MEMATATKLWTLEEVHSLPDDGNTYELVHGVLYVTPPPLDDHETVAARLTRVLDPHVAANGLGFVYRPNAVFRIGDKVQLEPDIMVRQPHPSPKGRDKDWETAPTPSLVIEILSPSTRRRDFDVKRRVYVDEGGIPEYWIAHADGHVVYVYRRGEAMAEYRDVVTWVPQGAAAPLVIDLDQIFPAN